MVSCGVRPKENPCPQAIPAIRASDSASAPPPRKLHDLAYGLERIGLIPLRAPVVSAIILAVLCVIAAFGIERIKVDDFAEPAVPLRHPGVPAIRRGDQALPLQRIRRAGGGRGQESDGAGVRSRSCATSSPTCSLIDSVRGLISLFSARQPPEAGKLPAPVFPETLPTGAGIRRAGPDACSATRSSAASFCRRTARWRWSCCRSIPRSSAARAQDHRRRNPQGHAGRPRRHRAYGAAGRRADHAARDPQRRRARHAALQHHRLRRRLPDRDRVLPPHFVHDHRGRRRR